MPFKQRKKLLNGDFLFYPNWFSGRIVAIKKFKEIGSALLRPKIDLRKVRFFVATRSFRSKFIRSYVAVKFIGVNIIVTVKSFAAGIECRKSLNSLNAEKMHGVPLNFHAVYLHGAGAVHIRALVTVVTAQHKQQQQKNQDEM